MRPANPEMRHIRTDHRPCPKCGLFRLKEWRELTQDEKMIVERLPMSEEFTLPRRTRHFFCTRCWFEDDGSAEMFA